MRCEEARDHLSELLLGSLDDVADAQLRRHLRGCGACRRELAALEQGLSVLATASEAADPPGALRERVLEAVRQEAVEAPPRRSFLRGPALRWAAVLVLLAGTLTWAGVATVHAHHLDQLAGRYSAFLEALGGRDVRVGVLEGRGNASLEGSVVVYDSEVGQSWVLVLARSAGLTGTARVELASPSGRSIDLRPLEFDPDGEASTWLVTATDLGQFDRCEIRDPAGRVLAAAKVTSE